MREYDIYIFDLDGTLLDTLQDLTDSVNHALRAFSMPVRTRDEVRMMVGNGVRLLIERAVPKGTKDGVTIQVFEEFRRHYLEHSLDSTHPYPGIIELMAELKRRGKKIAVVSNKLQPGVTDLCNRFFKHYADVAIGERIGIKRKPEPDMVREALRIINVRGDAVYIGDSDTDIVTARNSGLPCISVLWGFRDKDFLLAHGATTFALTPQEIINGENF